MENRNLQNVEKHAVTRFLILTKYDGESSIEQESDTGGMKNFPKAFIPMRELEESLPDA